VIIDDEEKLDALEDDFISYQLLRFYQAMIGYHIVPKVSSASVSKCRVIIDDEEKLDALEDDFISYQLLRFCQAMIGYHIVQTPTFCKMW
jgi:hypothetical protein